MFRFFFIVILYLLSTNLFAEINAKLRAIENRTGISLSANTGISGIINPLGEVTHKIRYNKQEVINGKVFLNNEVTFYSKYGNIFSKICFFISLLCLALIKLNRQR